MANTDNIPRHYKLGSVRSPFGNVAIEIANNGYVTFPSGVSFPQSLILDTSAAIAIGNTTTNAQINSTSLTIQNTTISSVFNNQGLNTTGTISVGNSTVNTFVNSSILIARSIQQANLNFVANASGVYVNGSLNATSYSIGTSTILDSTGLNTTSTVNANSFSIGSNFTANSTKLNHIGSINAGSFSMGSTFVSNTTALLHTSNTFTLGTATVQANNGFTKLPNGLLMQWGRSVANSTTGDITFPVAFSSLYNVQLTPNTNLNAWHAGLSTTAVSIRADSVSSPANVDVHWVAYGV